MGTKHRNLYLTEVLYRNGKLRMSPYLMGLHTKVFICGVSESFKIAKAEAVKIWLPGPDKSLEIRNILCQDDWVG